MVEHQLQVVEYSEIPKEVSERREEGSGKLTFRAANICNHFFTTEFLQRVCKEHLRDTVRIFDTCTWFGD